jgi:tetratricopeptide (TPR) repeat protein
MTAVKRMLPVWILIIGLGALYPMQRWIDRTAPQETINEEALYFTSGSTIKRMSLGFDAIAADIYWIRTVQYFGRKLIDSGKPVSSAATRDIRMDLLAPLLNIVSTLDPHHIPAYHFGAIFLPERDLPAATTLLEKGIRENPGEWRLYLDLGYIYWQAGNTSTGDEHIRYYAKAAEWYDRGSAIEGAPPWMKDLAGLMMMKGGSREAARAVYSAYMTSDDENVRRQAIDRLKQVRSLDEMDAINALLALYKQGTGTCPADLRVLASKLRAMNLALDESALPVDPDGFAYAYDASRCTVALAAGSTVSR